MNKKPLIYMLLFYLADGVLLGLLLLVASTKDPQLSLWFGEQGLAGFLWLFSSIIVYLILAIWVTYKGIILIKNRETKLGILTIIIAIPLLPFVLINYLIPLLSLLSP